MAPRPDPLFSLGSEPHSVEKVFREHNELLLSFLRARLRNESDAMEAAQEAYVRLLQLDDINRPSFMKAYLFKIAANVATDMSRRKRIGERFFVDAPADHGEPGLQERSVVAKEDLALIDRAIAELPARCREAFILKRQDDLSVTEIAGRLGVTDRMVRNYLIRALEHIQVALAGARDK